jgi:predicted nucleic acid-binding protein
MSEKVFVDSAILIHAHDVEAGEKRAIAEHVLRQLWQDENGTLSTQVLQEFYVHITRNIATPVPRRDARDLISAYRVWPVATLDVGDLLAASDLEERFRMSFRDATIVVAALKSGAAVLLSEELHSVRGISGLEVRNPFA